MNIQTELDRILKSESISTVFQPIVSLKDGQVIGYEALSRGPKNSPLQNPEKLFTAAQEYSRLWDLEYLCRAKAIEKAAGMSKDKLLFINIDPYILKDENFKKGITKEFLTKHNISPESIIFEITERTCVKDYKSFKAALDNYLEEGYKIAIDDTGSGYSGLKMLSETKPHYIKIDMELIRDIHKDTFKQHIISGLVSLANSTNMKLIAEGIENKHELEKLIELKVYAGQGFFLQKPADSFLDISDTLKTLICTFCTNHNNSIALYSKNYIGQLVRSDKPFNIDSSCEKLKKFFDTTNYTGACIVKDEVPVGLVMKHYLNSALATQYGFAVFLKRPASLVMNTTPLIVDYNTPVNDVSNLAMSRNDETLYDYVIVTKNSKYYGIVTVKKLLQFTTTMERNYAKELNPLTSLPGNSIINSKLNDMLSYNHQFCILYFDLDNFKIYNDTYGFENGDKVIKFTAELIKDGVKSFFPYNNFLGHIGGDDFIAIVDSDIKKSEELCKYITEQFDHRILDFFNERDKQNRYIEALDRKGNRDIFDITSISAAGVIDYTNSFESCDEIAKYIANIKREVKLFRHSNYKINILSDSGNSCYRGNFNFAL
jgi:EAL domain-containing protein (putative c-di-GMP-specific phosphodiesterase class I)/GGDEF domain-containing protein